VIGNEKIQVQKNQDIISHIIGEADHQAGESLAHREGSGRGDEQKAVLRDITDKLGKRMADQGPEQESHHEPAARGPDVSADDESFKKVA